MIGVKTGVLGLGVTFNDGNSMLLVGGLVVTLCGVAIGAFNFDSGLIFVVAGTIVGINGIVRSNWTFEQANKIAVDQLLTLMKKE